MLDILVTSNLAHDVNGRGLRASEFFARTRSGRSKGVVKIRRDSH